MALKGFNPAQELQAIIKKRDKVVAKIAAELFSDLSRHTPVDTGNLLGSWTIEKEGNTWVINNSAEYAEIRLSPYMEGGKLGSKKFPAGIEPIINFYNRKLQEELRKI